MTSFTSREASDVWKDKSADKVGKSVPAATIRARRGLPPRSHLLPYLGRESASVMLPARRNSASDVEPVLSQRSGREGEGSAQDVADNLPIEEATKMS